MRRRPHPQHAAIAKALGTTPASLSALLSIRAGRSAMNRGAWLADKGLAFYASDSERFYNAHGWRLTDAGEAIIAQARKMGL